MTMERKTKAKVQQAATSAKPVLSQSPSERAKYGKYLPAELGRKQAASVARLNKTYGRTRETVVAEKITARRTVGRKRVI